MATKPIDEMSKIELQEYAKRAKFVLGKNFQEKQNMEVEILELKREIQKLREMLARPLTR
jgi:hypothetical protein